VQIPVLMDGIRYSTGAEVAVAGAIVEKPKEKLAGYVGDAPQVVVVGYIFDPAKFADIDAGDGSAFTFPGD
jgi:hypothetical protein